MPRLSRPVVALLLLLPCAAAAQQEKTKTKEQPKKQQPPPERERLPKQPAPADTGRLDTLVVPQALKARSIGPAVMGGRVSDIALDPKDPFTYYVGLATGGVMKTTDNGETFSPIFEKESVAAIGAIAVAPSDSSVVWVGTGEANDRNSSSWGNGVYRSTDAGRTWTHVGLPNSKTIARIVVHPTDPKTAWVAAMGDLWSPNAERGLYRTTDAGATWKLVLSAPAVERQATVHAAAEAADKLLTDHPGARILEVLRAVAGREERHA